MSLVSKSLLVIAFVLICSLHFQLVFPLVFIVCARTLESSYFFNIVERVCVFFFFHLYIFRSFDSFKILFTIGSTTVCSKVTIPASQDAPPEEAQ